MILQLASLNGNGRLSPFPTATAATLPTLPRSGFLGILRRQGDTDMTTLVMETGSGMEKFDMGDAFVGPWDVANLVSDFLMQKMGAEVSACSSKIPTSIPPSTPFRLKTDAVRRVRGDLASDFSRYRFLLDFMVDDSKWDEANTVVALYQGYTPEDAEGEDSLGVGAGVRRGWARAFPGPSPPDLSAAEGVVEALEADFPDDPDMLEGLEVIVETVYGVEAKRVRSYIWSPKRTPARAVDAAMLWVARLG